MKLSPVFGSINKDRTLQYNTQPGATSNGRRTEKITRIMSIITIYSAEILLWNATKLRKCVWQQVLRLSFFNHLEDFAQIQPIQASTGMSRLWVTFK